jgi:hypothetical protein
MEPSIERGEEKESSIHAEREGEESTRCLTRSLYYIRECYNSGGRLGRTTNPKTLLEEEEEETLSGMPFHT